MFGRLPATSPTLPMRAPVRSLRPSGLAVLSALLTLVLTGCGSLSPSRLPETPIAVETATFTTTAPRGDVLALGRQLATSFGMGAGFVDVGGGRFESDYVSLRTVQEMLEDDLPGGPVLATTLVRFTLDALPGDRGTTTVRVRATMRPTTGAYYPQRTPGRYWLDRYAAALARAVEATYAPVISDAQYLDVLDRGGDVRAPAGSSVDGRRDGSDLSRGAKIAGLALLGVIAVSIAVTAF